MWKWHCHHLPPWATYMYPTSKRKRCPGGSHRQTKKQQYARDYVPVNVSDTELTLTTLVDIISAKLNLVGIGFGRNWFGIRMWSFNEVKSQLKRTKVIHMRWLAHVVGGILSTIIKFPVPDNSQDPTFVPSITPTKMLQLSQNKKRWYVSGVQGVMCYRWLFRF